MEFYLAMMAVSAAASIWGGQQQADAMERQADMLDDQAKLSLEQARWQADLQRKAGRERSMFIRRASRRVEGQAIVHVAGSGVDVSGSPLMAIADQVSQDEHAAATVMTNARLAATSTELEGKSRAVGAEYQAGELRSGAGVTRTVGMLDAIAKGMKAAGGYYWMTGGGSAPTEYRGYGYDAPSYGSLGYGTSGELGADY